MATAGRNTRASSRLNKRAIFQRAVSENTDAFFGGRKISALQA